MREQQFVQHSQRHQKNVNLVLLPRVGHTIHNVAISLRSIYVVGAVLILLMGVNLFVIKRYVGMRNEVLRLSHLETVNRDMAALEQTTERLEKELTAIRDSNTRIRQKTGLWEDISTDTPVPTSELSSRSLTPELEGLRERLVLLQGDMTVGQIDTIRMEKQVNGILDRAAHVPSIPPCRGGRITSGYGYRVHPLSGNYEFHQGVDISGDFGSPIYATADGDVEYDDWRSGYGLLVTLNHGNGFQTNFAHMSRTAVLNGDHVRKGQIIGYMGATGTTTGVHVHYEVRFNGQTVSPNSFLNLSLRDLESFYQ